MDEIDEIRAQLDATRSVVKALMRSCRTALQFLADLDDKLNAQPGGTANVESSNGARASSRV